MEADTAIPLAAFPRETRPIWDPLPSFFASLTLKLKYQKILSEPLLYLNMKCSRTGKTRFRKTQDTLNHINIIIHSNIIIYSGTEIFPQNIKPYIQHVYLMQHWNICLNVDPGSGRAREEKKNTSDGKP